MESESANLAKVKRARTGRQTLRVYVGLHVLLQHRSIRLFWYVFSSCIRMIKLYALGICSCSRPGPKGLERPKTPSLGARAEART